MLLQSNVWRVENDASHPRFVSLRAEPKMPAEPLAFGITFDSEREAKDFVAGYGSSCKSARPF